MLRPLENGQDVYKKRLNLLGQQTGADVTSGFRSQNEPKAIKKSSNIYLFCLKLSCLSEFYKKKKRTQLSELTNYISRGAFDRTCGTPATKI